MPVPRPRKEKGKRLWFRIVIRILPWIVKSYFRIVDLTSRKIFLNRHFEEEMERAGSFAVAGFHGTLLYPCYYCKRFGGVIMVSRSWDGDLMATCLRAWGYKTSRGSSSSDGKEALYEMIDMARMTNCCTGLAVDAPRGPAQIVKMGIVALARETGQPILPITSWATRHVQFNSWDKMILPLPFGTIVMNYGKPVRVSRELRKEDYEIVRQEIENNLLEALSEAKAKVAELKGPSTRTSIKSAAGS